MARGASRQASAAATPALGTDPGRPAASASPAEIRPAWGRARCRHHPPAEPRRPSNCIGRCPPQTEGVSRRDHSTARRQLRPGRRGHQSRRGSPSPSRGSSRSSNRSPRRWPSAFAIADARCGRGERDASSGWGLSSGVRCSTGPPRTRPERRARRTLRAPSVGARAPRHSPQLCAGLGRGTEAGRARAATRGEGRGGAGRRGGGLGAGRARPGVRG